MKTLYGMSGKPVADLYEDKIVLNSGAILKIEGDELFDDKEARVGVLIHETVFNENREPQGSTEPNWNLQ